MTDRIEKQIVLDAPVSRVWRALTDSGEFGEWFRVALEGPFVAGQEIRGRVTHPGFEHVVWRATVKAIEPEHRFAFTWHPYAVDSAVDYSAEPATLVEFLLEPHDGGTQLTLRESGFDAIPKERRADAFRMNDQGWAQQMINIRDHVGRSE